MPDRAVRDHNDAVPDLSNATVMWLSQVSAATSSTAALSYPLMSGAVFIGSVVPVLPTGPIVAATSALAESSSGFSFAFVLLLAAVCAFCGDILTFAICRSQGSRMLNWLVARHDSERLEWAREQMSRHAWRFIIVGRVIPAGRIPVLLAAGSLRYPWKGFLPAGALAASLWALLYGVVGVIGGALFDSPFVAVAAAAALALLVTAIPALYRRLRRRNQRTRTTSDS